MKCILNQASQNSQYLRRKKVKTGVNFDVMQKKDRLSSVILIYIKLLNSMDTQKYGNKKKLVNLKSFSFITCKLVIRKKLVNSRN